MPRPWKPPWRVGSGRACRSSPNTSPWTARRSRAAAMFPYPVSTVAAYAPQVEAVLAQVWVDAKTNEHKAALWLLGLLPLAGPGWGGRRHVLPARRRRPDRRGGGGASAECESDCA